MNQYKIYDYYNFSIYVSLINGNQILIKKPYDQEYLKEQMNSKYLLEEIEFPSEYNKRNFEKIYICIHGSSRCNLKCKYCFVGDRQINKELTSEECKIFIDQIIRFFPNKTKYIIDLSGSAEPLLNLDLIISIAEYCNKIASEKKYNIITTFVSNGTLLDKKTVKTLQKLGVIFGVSLDGYRYYHNLNRINHNNQGTFDNILSNVKKIKNNEFLGAAITLNNAEMNLIDVYKTLIKYFPTISVKIVRTTLEQSNSFSDEDIYNIKQNYDDLYTFLLEKTLKKDLKYIKSILRGDDYFGKFIKRVFVNVKTNHRCDAGVSRFSLTQDHKIVACPAAINISELEIGTLKDGLDISKMKQLWRVHEDRFQCMNCEAKFVCGGECFVQSFNKSSQINKNDLQMCEIKMHFFKLAIKFKFDIMTHDLHLFNEIYKYCEIVLKY